MKRKRYRCPNCGRMMEFGNHFCETASNEDKSERPDVGWNTAKHKGKSSFKKLGTLLIVAFIAGAMLWPFLDWKATLVVGMIIIAGTGITLIISSRRRSTSGADYRSLVKLTAGDKDVAERLISAEMARYPDFTRSECIRRVHDRLEYEFSR